ncbi:long-chain fatty acid--CoA ligase [bacterium]|nr:long-chain fatty acid--CoA ligase [bacterium]
MNKKYKNLVEMQQHSCQMHKDRKMYATKGSNGFSWITFRQFETQVNEFRSGLATLGVSREDKIGIIAGNCVEWAVGAYATYGLGAHYVPMYESQLLKEWIYILNDSGTKVLLVRNPDIFKKAQTLVDEIECLQHVVPLFEDAGNLKSYTELKKAGKQNPVSAYYPASDETMGLIYTSGTTGNPKGVVLTHANILTEMDSLDQASVGDPITNEDRGLSFLPWGHLMGQIQEVHLLLYYGFSSGLVRDINEIGEDLSLIRPTIFFSVPRLFNKICDGINQKIESKGPIIRMIFNKGLEANKSRFAQKDISLIQKIWAEVANRLIFKKIRMLFGGRLRMSFSGGAALSKDIIEFLDCLGIPVYEGYGQTETSMAVTMNTPEHRRFGSVGKPLPNARVVLDKSVDSARDDEGEIIVYGPLLMKEYHNLPDVTKATIDPDGGLRTGDIGRFDEDGFLFLTGRIKEIYKMENGKYVSPGPIEEQLKNSPYISQTMVSGTNQLFNVALIIPEEEALVNFAKKNSIDTASSDWKDDPKIYQLFEGEIKKYTEPFKKFERPNRFALVWDDWSTDNGFLTPTLKLKRRLIFEKYAKIIEQLHAV